MERIYEDIKNCKPYGRLSDEDRNKKGFSMESDSIASQRTYILQFCKDHNIKHSDDGYYDDGITGQTFERDGWNNLLKEIELGKIDCVITKDLSRLGRDHSETGYYIEKFFPEHGIRYISINDNWDSKYDSVDLILWKLAYNDVYCADISRKVKSILNSKKRDGQYVGAFAAYGYMKDPNDKHKLIVDEETAPIVKEIFDLSLNGMGNCGIAKLLTERKISTPGVYSKRGGRSIISQQVGNVWTTGMIRRILSNEVYMGDTIQCKLKKVSYKSKKVVRNNRDDWIIVKNTHEALVSRDAFAIIQEKLKLTSKKYTRLPGEQHLFSKLIYCKDCNHRISISWKNPKHHDWGVSGVCNYYKKYSKYGVCTPHYIDYLELETQILNYLRAISKKYLEYLDTPKLIKENYKNIRNLILEQEAKKNKIKKELEKAEAVLLKLYEDKLCGEVTESIYKILSLKKQKEIDNINEELDEINAKINSLNKQLDDSKDKQDDIKSILKNFLDSKEINQSLIHQIISKILVSENNEIDVIFKIKELENVTI